MSTNGAIVTIYENNNLEVKWDKVSGKIRVSPGGEWLFPEGRDERIELMLSLCDHLDTETMQMLVEAGHVLNPSFGQMVAATFSEKEE